LFSDEQGKSDKYIKYFFRRIAVRPLFAFLFCGLALKFAETSGTGLVFCVQSGRFTAGIFEK